jgi:hypothetical protein
MRILIYFILLVVLYLYSEYKQENNIGKKDNNEVENMSNNIIETQNSVPIGPTSDLVTMTDYRMIYDPLLDPWKRPPKYIVGPLIGNPHLNIPTRGYPDSFSLYGYLVNGDKIHKLYGREKFPNSTEYEYFAEIFINNNNNTIKYEIKKNKELYDGDKVYIDLLNNNFEVKLLKTKGLEYNPYSY